MVGRLEFLNAIIITFVTHTKLSLVGMLCFRCHSRLYQKLLRLPGVRGGPGGEQE